MLRQERCADFDISGDPVWPDLPMSFRLGAGKEVFSYIYKGEVAAIVCVAYCDRVPTTMLELSEMSGGWIAVPYTVWSYRKGFGRSIILALLDHLKEARVERVVTMSPKTEMAFNFHTSNGAKQIARNPDSDNYEYDLG